MCLFAFVTSRERIPYRSAVEFYHFPAAILQHCLVSIPCGLPWTNSISNQWILLQNPGNGDSKLFRNVGIFWRYYPNASNLWFPKVIRHFMQRSIKSVTTCDLWLQVLVEIIFYIGWKWKKQKGSFCCFTEWLCQPLDFVKRMF